MRELGSPTLKRSNLLIPIKQGEYNIVSYLAPMSEICPFMSSSQEYYYMGQSARISLRNDCDRSMLGHQYINIEKYISENWVVVESYEHTEVLQPGETWEIIFDFNSTGLYRAKGIAGSLYIDYVYFNVIN